jgi:AcrR family transcriptional regulator
VGVEALTTRDVARRAGVSTGTLYQYFSGMPALLAAWEERTFGRSAGAFVARVQQLFGRGLSPDEMVSEVAGMGFDAMLHHMRYYRDRSRAELVSRIRGRNEVGEGFIDGIAAVLAAGQPQSRLRRTDHKACARLGVVSVFSAARDAWAKEADDEEIACIRREVQAMITAYVLRDP